MSGHMKALGDNIASHNDFFKFIKSDLLLNEFFYGELIKLSIDWQMTYLLLLDSMVIIQFQ